MAVSILLALCLRVASGDCDGVCTHARPNPLSFVAPSTVMQPPLNGLPTMVTSTDTVSSANFNVTVTWSGVGHAHSSDYIGMWPASSNLTLFSAPIKFHYTTPRGRKNPGYGSVVFEVINLRTDVVFYYVSGNAQYPELRAQTQPVKNIDNKGPAGAHLALGKHLRAMRVYWQAGAVDKPGVKFGTESGKYDSYVPGLAAPGRQFTRGDMCDTLTQPAGRQGFFKPSTLLEASMEPLIPGATYYYVYGDDATGWSEERSFVAAPGGDADRRTVIAAFGDMGQTEADHSFHHSFDFDNRGEIPSLNTTRALTADRASELIYHIGDISYAVGYLNQWENFFHQVEAVASRKPYMTSIGNHEQVWSESFVPGDDSGGECGVPYNAYFPFASQDPDSKVPFGQKEPWYSFTYGNIAFIQMSTEHDYTLGSAQYAWLVGALQAVDRSVTPWLVFSGHRPMYVANTKYQDDNEQAAALRKYIEPLLLKYEVDLALWAHFHAYVRTCPLLNGTCVPEDAPQSGIHHYIIGMAGYEHSECPAAGLPAYVAKCDDTKYGYIRITSENRTTLSIDYVDNENGDVLESSFVRRNRATPSPVIV